MFDTLTDEELYAAGFNRAWKYDVKDGWNWEESNFSKVKATSALWAHLTRETRELKYRVFPILKGHLYSRGFMGEFDFKRIAGFFEILKDNGRVKTLDELLFALRTATWYLERKLFCFWTDTTYCIYRATTKKNTPGWVEEPLDKWIERFEDGNQI